MTTLRYPCRVCLRKLAVIPGRPPGRIPVGACYVGEAKSAPRPGHRFRLMQSESGRGLLTSEVQRLLTAQVLVTYNSVYQLEVVAAPVLRLLRMRRTRRAKRKADQPAETGTARY